MKKGGDAGAGKVREVASPPGAELTAPAPIRPQMIEGRVDNGKEPIALKAIRSWGSDAKYGFMLALSGNAKLNQPTARVLLSYPTAAPDRRGNPVHRRAKHGGCDQRESGG